MTTALAVLIVEDSESDGQLIVRVLKKAGYDVVAERVETAEQMRAAWGQRAWDIVISDYSLPQFDGRAALTLLQETGQDIPFIVVSGAIGEETAVAMMKAGAHDYLLKGNLARLTPAVERELAQAVTRRERTRAEAALRESEARFRGLLEFAPDAVLIVNREGRLTFANARAEKMFGYQPDELLDQWIEMLVPDRFRGRHGQHRFGFMAAPGARPMDSRRELQGQRKDGSEFDADIMLGPLETGGELSVLCIVRDITERKRAEDALKTSEANYRRLFEAAKDGILILDANTGEVKDVNPFLIEMLGYSHTEFLGKQLWEIGLLKDIAANKSAFRQLQENKHIRYENLPLETIDGGRIFVEFVSNVYDVNGKQIIQCNIRDITERRQAEKALAEKNEEIKAMSQQLWQAARLATMGELAASIAHELNNPLGTVSLRVESLLSQMPPGDPGRRELEVIEQEAERMGTLVAHLLQLSRRGTPQVSTVDVREEIENTLELIHYHFRQRQITVQREFAPDVPMVQADRQQLRQLFLNLFTNAGDAMLEGGTLTIRVYVQKAESGRQKAEDVLALPSADRLLPSVCIEVADTGTGIAPEDLPRVTEPFFTTKPEGKGTGLGLAICRRIVQEHNGTFEITSAGAGQGTTVRLTLPGTNDSHEVFLEET